jgi:hypothetical protein
MPLAVDRRQELLAARAGSYVTLGLANIEREYPHMPWLVVTEPGPLPGHRNLHPVFYGSFDWHSCVEMFWLAARLLRLYPSGTPQGSARYTLDSLLASRFLVVEEQFFLDPKNRSFERPYGWGWLLALQAELETWEDPDARRWAAQLRPLADIIVNRFLEWLPKQTYPIRVGTHPNTAFGILRSLDHANWLAEQGDPAFLELLTQTTRRLFGGDRDYPIHYEPSGADFLSAGLTEAELMSRVMPDEEFRVWFGGFLPQFARGERMVTPAVVTDPSDGQGAHLAGLNLSRAASMMAIAGSLPEDDPRQVALRAMAGEHADASLASATGSDYMVEHWLVAYATLYLTA